MLINVRRFQHHTCHNVNTAIRGDEYDFPGACPGFGGPKSAMIPKVSTTLNLFSFPGAVMRCTELSNVGMELFGCVRLQTAAEHTFLKEIYKPISIIVITSHLPFHRLLSHPHIFQVVYLCLHLLFPAYRTKCHRLMY